MTSFVGTSHHPGLVPPACKHVNIETWKKVLPWITGLYTHTHLSTGSNNNGNIVLIADMPSIAGNIYYQEGMIRRRGMVLLFLY